jgi:flagellar biosynthesis GTPase FlhF
MCIHRTLPPLQRVPRAIIVPKSARKTAKTFTRKPSARKPSPSPRRRSLSPPRTRRVDAVRIAGRMVSSATIRSRSSSCSAPCVAQPITEQKMTEQKMAEQKMAEQKMAEQKMAEQKMAEQRPPRRCSFKQTHQPVTSMSPSPRMQTPLETFHSLCSPRVKLQSPSPTQTLHHARQPS